MRIVSLLPASTEIVVALGLADDLVGVTHACVVPEAAGRPAVLTRPVPAPRTGRAGRHERAQAVAHAGAAAFDLDVDALVQLAPDLVLVQERCPACRRAYRIVDQATRERLGRRAAVVSLEPATVDGILHAIATVGAMTSAEDEAVGLVELLRERLADVEEVVAARRDAGHRPPRVVALDWLDPPIASGHWVPEQVRRAGGWDVLGEEGAAARATSMAELRELDPELIVLMPCAWDLAQTLAAWRGARRPDAWADLGAVRRGQVFAVDGARRFSRPAPAAIEGIELLAELLDPDAFADVAPPGSWVPAARD